jgi:hypothetical protein
MFWLMLEYRVRHPRQDEFDLFEDEEYEDEKYEDEDDEPPVSVATQPRQQRTSPPVPAQGKNRVARAVDAIRGKETQPVAQASPDIDYDKLADAMSRKQQPQSPLAQPQLDTKQPSQSGQTNGNGNH